MPPRSPRRRGHSPSRRAGALGRSGTRGLRRTAPARRGMEQRRDLGPASVRRGRGRRRDRRLPPRETARRAAQAPRRHWCSHRRSVSSHSRARSGRSLSRSPRCSSRVPCSPVRSNAATPSVGGLRASAAVLPLTHPVAASALAAQVLALVVARREVELRARCPAVAIATLESLFFLTASVIDRADAVDGAGSSSCRTSWSGSQRSAGARWGSRGVGNRHARPTSSNDGRGLWKPALVTGLAAMPLVAVLAAGTVLPVFPREALTVAAGGIALAAGIGLLAIPDRELRLASRAAVTAVAIAALVTAAARSAEDWRSRGRLVESRATPRDTVVAPSAAGRRSRTTHRMSGRARSVEARRCSSSPPVTPRWPPRVHAGSSRRPATLLWQEQAGTRLVVQRWVRP